MRRLDRYILNHVLLMIALVLSVFIGIYVVFSFVGEMHNFSRNYGFLLAILSVLFSIPANLIFILPISSLLGTLIALGNLASHSELTAMRSVGISISRIAISVLKAGLFIAMLSFIFSAFLGPFFAKEALLIELNSKKDRSFLLTPEATWLKDGSDFVYIGRSGGADLLRGVVKYHFEQGNLVSIISANSATYKDGSWHLFKVKQVNLSKSGVSETETLETTWPELVPPNLLKAVSSDITNLNLVQLYRYVSYRTQNGLDAGQYELKIWQMYAQPLSILVLMLIGIPFAFGQLRSSTLGVRLVIGVGLGIGFFLIDRFFGPVTLVLSWPPFLGAFLPCFIFLGAALIFFWRLK